MGCVHVFLHVGLPFSVEPLNGLDLIVYFFRFHWIKKKRKKKKELRSRRDREVINVYVKLRKGRELTLSFLGNLRENKSRDRKSVV